MVAARPKLIRSADEGKGRLQVLEWLLHEAGQSTAAGQRLLRVSSQLGCLSRPGAKLYGRNQCLLAADGDAGQGVSPYPHQDPGVEDQREGSAAYFKTNAAATEPGRRAC